MNITEKDGSAVRNLILLGVGIALAVVPAVTLPAQDSETGFAYTFKTFHVPGAAILSANGIDRNGTVSGYYTDAGGDYKGYLRSPAGVLTTLVDPLNTGSPAYTIAGQISEGTLVGEFYDTAAATYSGFLYSEGNYTTYNLPNQPSQTTTGINGVNDHGDLCGFVQPPPYNGFSAFVRINGVVHIFQVQGSTQTSCNAINANGDAVGSYKDAAGVTHGFLRYPAGEISTFDVPGASAVPGAAACISGSIAGTFPVGINIYGEISGHYWGTNYNEKGFVRTTAGKFRTINVPGAFQTGAGGVNDHGTVVGHFKDVSCNTSGFIASP